MCYRVGVKFSVLSMLAFLMISFAADARHYQAPLHAAKWTVKKNQMECRLQQIIPDYGKAVFTKHALYGYGFHLKARRGLVKKQSAKIRSVPSDWSADKSVKELSALTMNKGKISIKIARNLSVKLLAELEKGRFPTFFFKDSPGPDDEISVALSAVNFRIALDKFVTCGTRLARFRFKYIRHRTVYFDSGKHKINLRFEKQLDKIAAYIIYNQNVQLVRIDGHTDIIGGYRYNLRLSKQRARAIKKYLLKRNVPAHLIKTRHFGKLQPAVSNRNAGGRRKNRRVSIRLHKN